MNSPLSDDSPARGILVTGATGYLGRALIPVLLDRGHRIRALVRAGAQPKVAAGVDVVVGDVLNASDVARSLAGVDTIVHLVGVPKPSPTKAQQFRDVDLVSIQATVWAIANAGARPHLVYVSVAQPAPIMRAYLAVRAAGETLIREHNLRATIFRPWYVLGPGHRWPHLLRPIYAVLRVLPPTRGSAIRLGLVTLPQMIRALVQAVENPSDGIRMVEVPAIKGAAVSS